MASSSEVCDISNTHTRPSVEPVASESGWLGWNLTCLDENTNVCLKKCHTSAHLSMYVKNTKIYM